MMDLLVPSDARYPYRQLRIPIQFNLRPPRLTTLELNPYTLLAVLETFGLGPAGHGPLPQQGPIPLRYRWIQRPLELSLGRRCKYQAKIMLLPHGLTIQQISRSGQY